MTIVYKPFDTDQVEQYRCRLSGRREFDPYEASSKARWLTANQHAEWALVFDGEQLHARWEWCPYQQGPKKILGPDL